MLLRQSTAAALTIGPILDANGAEYAGAVIGDISISKNGTLTALASAATLDHESNGIYRLALTTGNTDTLGRVQLVCNKSTYQMPLVGANVIPATVYDALVTNAVNTTGGLPAATGTISALAGAISTFAGGAVASVTAPVTVGTNNDKSSYSLSAAANQAIGDAFLAHVLTKGTAGTVERAFWQSSKTSASLTGEVLASGSNTATSFATDIAIDDFAGQVLAMVSGALAGEARAIQSVSSGVVTLQKPLTGTPSAADEFVVIPSQVYAVSEIQAGLATSAALATVQADTDDIQSRLPAALVSGRMDSYTGAMGANTLTAAATAADFVTEVQSGLSTLTAAQVNAELLDVLQTDLFAELAAVPAASSSLKDKISFLFMLARNKVTQTASTQTLFADNTTTPVAASATSDVGGTFTRGEFA